MQLLCVLAAATHSRTVDSGEQRPSLWWHHENAEEEEHLTCDSRSQWMRMKQSLLSRHTPHTRRGHDPSPRRFGSFSSAHGTKVIKPKVGAAALPVGCYDAALAADGVLLLASWWWMGGAAAALTLKMERRRFNECLQGFFK